MKRDDIFTAADGNDYRAVEIDTLRCENCERITQTGLCGCGNSSPVVAGKSLVGFPIAAEIAAFSREAS